MSRAPPEQAHFPFDLFTGVRGTPAVPRQPAVGTTQLSSRRAPGPPPPPEELAAACGHDRPGRVADPGRDERLRFARCLPTGSLGYFARSYDQRVAAGGRATLALSTSTWAWSSSARATARRCWLRW